MDKEQLQQKIAEYFVKLPKEAQDIFSSMKWLDVLKDIEIKYSLDGKQIETLGTETTLLLLGILHVEEYKNILENELKLDKGILEKIFIEIDEKILKNIKDQLIQTFEANATSLNEEVIDKEVPLPPYAKTINSEGSGIKSAKVEEIPLPKPVSTTTPSLNSIPVTPKPAGESAIKNDETIPKPTPLASTPPAQTQTPQSTPTLNPMEEKMKGPTASNRSVSDLSTPKSVDPYREVI